MIAARKHQRGGNRLCGSHVLICHSLRVLAILLLAIIAGCSERSGEPPLSFGKGASGSLARHTKLVKRQGGPASLSPGNDYLNYEIEYPNHGLKSIATVGFMVGSLREEIFPKKWKVIYDYEGTWEGRDWMEAYGIPLSIRIYAYSGGKYSRDVNIYRLSKIVPNFPVYRDRLGKEKTIAATYFQVGPGFRF